MIAKNFTAEPHVGDGFSILGFFISLLIDFAFFLGVCLLKLLLLFTLFVCLFVWLS